MKEKLHGMKEWMSKHSTEIVVYGTLAGTFVFTIWYAKKYNEAIAEYNQALVEEANARQKKMLDAINSGKSILPNPDGSFWIVDLNQVDAIIEGGA